MQKRFHIALCALTLSGGLQANTLLDLLDHQPIALPAIADLGGSDRKAGDLEQRIASVLTHAFGVEVSARQDKRGVLTVESPVGRFYGLPLSPLRRDGFEGERVEARENGGVAIGKDGVMITLIPSLGDLQLAVRRLRLQFGAGAELEVRDDGTLLLTTGERPRATDAGVYCLRPEWLATPSGLKVSGLWKLNDGRYIFRDEGREQELRPAFANLPGLIASLKETDPDMVWSLNTDSTLSARVKGQVFQFAPDPRLVVVPKDYVQKSWWLDSGDFYLQSKDGKTAQRVTVR